MLIWWSWRELHPRPLGNELAVYRLRLLEFS